MVCNTHKCNIQWTFAEITLLYYIYINNSYIQAPIYTCSTIPLIR